MNLEQKICLKDNLCLHVQKLILSLTSICLSLQRKQKNLLYTISVGVKLTFYYLKKGRSRSPIATIQTILHVSNIYSHFFGQLEDPLDSEINSKKSSSLLDLAFVP